MNLRGTQPDGEPRRDETAIGYVRAAGAGAAVLCAGVALLRAALALGLPLGDATFGGAAPTEGGVLSPGFRVIAAINAGVLILFAAIFLARADIVRLGFLGDRLVYWATWGIVGFLVLNTIGNLAAPHPVERWGMGSITLVPVLLGAYVALRSPRRRRSTPC